MLQLIDTDKRTVLAENDEDPRAESSHDSYIEWTCDRKGVYYIKITGAKGKSGAFTIKVTTQVLCTQIPAMQCCCTA